MALEKIEMSLLFDIYGELLNDKQRIALEMYINDDLSLAEIAENTGISRQGVYDQIKHAEMQIETFEKKLGLLGRMRIISADLAKISDSKEIKNNPELDALIKDIQKNLNFE